MFILLFLFVVYFVLAKTTNWIQDPDFFIITAIPFLTKSVNLKVFKSKLYRLQKLIRSTDNDLVKGNSNHIYGLRKIREANKLDFSQFNNILYLNSDSITVESNVTIKEILDFLIPQGLMLNVIPDLGHLTMGGVIAGVGGGSASFKYGYFHENVLQCDILTGNGDILTCSKKQNKDLFYGIANTLGTLGYITRLTLKICPSKPFVKTVNIRFTTYSDFFDALAKYQKDPELDFLDGTIFSNTHFILVLGYLKQNIEKKLDNFKNDKVYWQSISTAKEHWFTLSDYIYRWNTDLYYTSMFTPQWLNNSKLRRCIPAKCIPTIKKILPYLGVNNNVKDIVQDVLIPFPKMKEFYQWYDENVALYPVYICPAQSNDDFSFWKKDLMCDFGIGYGVEKKEPVKATKMIEKKMIELKGRKFLYSKTRMTETEFWTIYNKSHYDKLRKKYHSKFPQWFTKAS